VGFAIRTLVTAASLWAAMQIVPGLSIHPPAYTGTPQTDYVLALLISALALGILNAFVRPLLLLLSLPITCMTLGLFVVVVNGLMIVVLTWLPFGMHVDGFFSAIVGALIVSVVSFVLNRLVPG
jgi:putative membrane protein